MNDDGRDTFVFYPSFYDSIHIVKDPLLQLAMYEAIARFGITGEEPDTNAPDAVRLIMPQIEASIRHQKQNRKNGKNGGAPKGNQNAKKDKTTEKQPKTTQNNLYVDGNANDDGDWDGYGGGDDEGDGEGAGRGEEEETRVISDSELRSFIASLKMLKGTSVPEEKLNAMLENYARNHGVDVDTLAQIVKQHWDEV